MIPYYEDDHVELYLGDCREILPALVRERMLVPDEYVIVTDPPYGIDLDTDYSSLKGNAAYNVGKGYHSGKTYRRIVGDDEPFDPRWLDGTRRVLFGADHYSHLLPPGGSWHVWDKCAGLFKPNMFGDAELVWSSWRSGPPRVYRHMWKGYHRASEQGAFLHPTQKPVSLMRWILDWTPAGVVVDPYAGSGPTLRAAKDLGRRAVGIEVDEEYCSIIARRLSQETLPFDLDVADVPAVPVELDLYGEELV